MTDTTPPRASEGGHWYDPKTGQPVYQVDSADGKKKIDCTLRQARKLGLVPGITSITRMLAAPELDRWKQNNVLMSALTLPRQDGETDQAYIARIVADADQQAEKARTEGTAIHAALEAHYKGEPYDPAYAEHVRGAVAAIDAAFPGQKWRAEVVAVTPRYGTKIDLLSDSVIVDFKGKDFGPDNMGGPDDRNGLLTYPQHWMQLWAGDLAAGQGVRAKAICYVSRNHPGLAVVAPLSEEQASRGGRMWNACLTLWRNKNDYYPGE